MSEENVLIPRARYENMLERLSKLKDGSSKEQGDETVSPSTGMSGEHSDDIESDQDGRSRDDIIKENELLMPPGHDPSVSEIPEKLDEGKSLKKKKSFKVIKQKQD